MGWYFEHFWVDRNQSESCLYSQMALRPPCVTGKSCTWDRLLAAMGSQAALSSPSEVWHGQKYGLALPKCCVSQGGSKILQAQTDICSKHELRWQNICNHPQMSVLPYLQTIISSAAGRLRDTDNHSWTFTIYSLEYYLKLKSVTMSVIHIICINEVLHTPLLVLTQKL